MLALLAICLVPALSGAALYLSHLRAMALRDAYREADLVALRRASGSLNERMFSSLLSHCNVPG